MMIQGKVINVSLDVDYPKKDGGGSYAAFVLKYVNGRNEVREIVKPMQGLKFKPTIAKVLRELQPNDVFSLQMEKNKAGYDDIVALKKGEPGVEMAAQSMGASGSNPSVAASAPTGRVMGSTYETAEERKIKQRLIVRQAALNQSLEFHSKDKTQDADFIKETAQVFEEWVYRGME